MNALFLLINDFPLVPFFIFALAGGVGIYLLMVISRKILDEHTAPPPELTKAGDCLKIQALERQGVMKNDAFGRQPELTFRRADCEFVVSVNEGGKGHPRITFVTFQTEFFTDVNYRIASQKFKALFSFSRIKSFSGEISRKYDLEGSDGVFIGNLLSQEIQIDLLKYEKATEVRFGMHVGVQRALKPSAGRFYLSTEGFKVEAEDYDCLIETAFKFYDRLKTMSAAQRINNEAINKTNPTQNPAAQICGNY